MIDLKKYKDRSSGFTLIELLVVVLIIGILAAIAVPQYFKVVEKGRFGQAMTNFSVVKGAQERYLLKAGSYATNVSLLDVGSVAMADFTGTTMSAGANTWSLVLARNATGAPGGNTYSVTYTGPAGTLACAGAGSVLCNDMIP